MRAHFENLDGYVVDKLASYEAVIAHLYAPHLKARLTWSSTGAPWRFSLVGALPPVSSEGGRSEGKLVLRPERGVGGAISAVGEIEVQDKLVDDAWVVRGDAPGLLLAMLPELRELAPLAPSIDVDAVLTVSFDSVAGEHGKRAADGALALWHRVSFFGLA